MRKSILIFILVCIISSIIYIGWPYIHFLKPNFKATPIETIDVKYNSPTVISGIQTPTQTSRIRYVNSKGYINHWFVKNSAKVKKQTPLFEYYNPSIEHQITAKQKYLAHLKQIPPNKYTSLNLEIQRTQYEIETLQSQLRTTIYAPLDGIVTINQTNPSEKNELILQIYQPNAIIKTEVPETIVNSLELKDKLRIKIDPVHSFTGEIISIAPLPVAIDHSKQKSHYTMTITSKPEFHFGKHFQINIPSRTIEIPSTAIYDNQFVFLKRNKKFIKRVIKAQKMGNNKHVLILEGLRQGDKIAKDASTVLSKQ
ncbi:efflux RND transporter periplasmic adaptor subunit [Staphylococcus caeli]|uniref:Membrane protein n=1 Tax=Staphylococcus caeli TaxID=2201815 RepID=A0A1D4HZE9_9STAP|nr:efflux RND transporter periplasmic adaptor subunit [Staphylococcus caeli]SCS23894.1 membrane protein [Staphylococcus caeli]SCS42458.1 membrane protein [Staphylococcus caeli]